jgi:hypothetical protein
VSRAERDRRRRSFSARFLQPGVAVGVWPYIAHDNGCSGRHQWIDFLASHHAPRHTPPNHHCRFCQHPAGGASARCSIQEQAAKAFVRGARPLSSVPAPGGDMYSTVKETRAECMCSTYYVIQYW